MLSVRKLEDEQKDFGPLAWYLNNRFGTALRKNWVRRRNPEKAVQPVLPDKGSIGKKPEHVSTTTATDDWFGLMSKDIAAAKTIIGCGYTYVVC